VRVIAAAPGRFEVEAVAAGHDGRELARIAVALGARYAAVAAPSSLEALKEGLRGHPIEAGAGDAAIVEAATRDDDLVVSGIVGAAGLAPTYAAVAAGKTVALANKESLVCAGAALTNAARASGATILPMDSEHNAIFQAIGDRDPATVVSMILTASGGPFREWSAARIAAATPEEALAHPNWSMGPKISVDSASLMNKGLELIEARHLFDLAPERLSVLVHPQSIVHGMVGFADGSMIAGLARPDMRTPIAHCLAYPDRIDAGISPPDLAALRRLTFEEVDEERFPALRLARAAMFEGDGATAALNAANEVAVAGFLVRRIGFGAMAGIVERTIDQMRAANELKSSSGLAEALAIHHVARERARRLLA